MTDKTPTQALEFADAKHSAGSNSTTVDERTLKQLQDEAVELGMPSEDVATFKGKAPLGAFAAKALNSRLSLYPNKA